jgi:hypothetical protein
VNKVLVDGGELLAERTIQLLDDLRITLHGAILQNNRPVGNKKNSTREIGSGN